MTQQGLFALFLFLHVLGAVVAFGPALSFSLIGPFGGRESQHANFTTRLQEMLARRLVVPVGLTLPITGAGMILTAQIDLAARPNWWLGIAIVIYTVLMVYAIFIQVPAVSRVVELTKGGPPPGAAPVNAGPGSAAPGGGAPGAPGPGGPSPHVLAAINKVKQGGIFLSALIVIIVLLMTVKPRF
ncbi:MAG: DUF2269 family protein [Chloroflexi bacterium]|nr:DUF2269 family protein [Chloroflexota bacterium]